MKALSNVLREIIALFVDDGFLAATVIGVVTVATAIATALPAGRTAVGAFLLFGCVAVLVTSVFMAPRR